MFFYLNNFSSKMYIRIKEIEYAEFFQEEIKINFKSGKTININYLKVGDKEEFKKIKEKLEEYLK